MSTAPVSVRLDKWLWAARFFKTRSLATQEIDKGRVRVNGHDAKPSRDLKPGDVIELRQGPLIRAVLVKALSQIRGPAPQAQALYEETPDSIARRQHADQARREAPEPSLSIEQGRPTKKDRRELADWNRWSASIKDE